MSEINGTKITIGPEQAGIDAALITPPGGILFSNNTVITAVATSDSLPVAILGLSDVAIVSNQFDCQIQRSLTPITVIGDTLRVEQNRCVDSSYALSLATHGTYNITTHNITDYCISATGTDVINQQNLELHGGLCKVFSNVFNPIVGLGAKQ